MKIKKKFSCYLIGDSNLSINCAKLLNCSQNLLGILSKNSQLLEWAASQNIYHTHFDAEFYDTLKNRTFDYLFSVVNYRILTQEIIKSPRYFAINYHNAPLPRYGGLNAASWAILNQEKEHGITWHIMNDVIDGGDILKQSLFPIHDHETGLTLDIRCHEQALASLKDLIEELNAGNFTRTPQDFSKRSYHSFQHQPINYGILQWTENAEQIDRVWRGLNYSHHENRFCSAKFNIDSEFFYPQKLIILDTVSSGTAGTIKNLKNNAIQITTGSTDIEISQIMRQDGLEYSIAELEEKFGLRIGYQFSELELAELKQLHATAELVAKEELFWLKQFERETSDHFPIATNHKIKSSETIGLTLSDEAVVLADQITQREGYDQNIVIIAAFLVYLYRISDYENNTVGLITPKIKPPLHEALFSHCLPCDFDFKFDTCFSEILPIVDAKLKNYAKKNGYAKDLWLRYPSLREKNNLFNCVIEIATDINANREDQPKRPLCLTVAPGRAAIFANLSMFINTEQHELIMNMPAHIKNILMNIIEAPTNKKLFELTFLQEKERHCFREWNMTDAPYPSKTVHQIFSEQAAKTPHHLAVKAGSQSINYLDLEKQSNQLANYLSTLGIKPGSVVGIFIDRGIEAIISMLAILKSGCAYLPIHMSSPPAYIATILKDSQASCLILFDPSGSSATVNLQDFLCTTCEKIHLLYFDPQLWKTQPELIDIHTDNAHQDDMAYIMYTSGSTGKPKGVMIPHRGIVRLVRNTNYMHIVATDKVAQIASLGFDVSVFEIWTALLHGACLVCPPFQTILDADQFADFLKNKQISVIMLTPALFDQYVSLHPDMFRYVNYLFVVADVLNPKKIKAVLECSKNSPRHFINAYGPTENTGKTTSFEIPKEIDGVKPIPIGKPISNTTTYVLDKYHHLMPIGTPGELYAGGAGLALGYIGNAELTKEKFLQLNVDGQLINLYRTGDRAYQDANGLLHFLGRIDQQVKVRGFRVETRGIEEILLQHETIEQCAVVVQTGQHKNKHLVAYVTVKNNANFDSSAIISFLKSEIPHYLIPTKFIKLTRMPLSPSGKIDRKSLERLEIAHTLPSHSMAIAKTKTEKKLYTLFCEILNLEDVGTDDNFFHLGGHSLLVSQLIISIRKTFDFNLRLHNFLTSPTIAHVAKLIDENICMDDAQPSQINFLEEIKLPPTIIVNKTSKPNMPPKSILLTGATGFLGTHLLHQLYTTSTAIIYCLVRSDSADIARKKIGDTLKKYGLSIELDDRIKIILGDLAKPKVGLAKQDYEWLSKSVDAIIHNGAYVNHLYDYRTLKSANVLATIELLKVSVHHVNKHFHYISTLPAVAHLKNQNGFIRESFATPELLSNAKDGYTQTKWVSECLLAEAAQRGIRVSIYRPSWIVGDSRTGICPPSNIHLFLLLKSCIQLGVAPAWEARLNLFPVDMLSAVIGNAILHNKKNKIYNLANSYPVSWLELIKQAKKMGYKIDIVSEKKWHDRLLKMHNTNALFPLLSLYFNLKEATWIAYQDNMSDAINLNTQLELEKLSISSIKITEEMLDIFFQQFVRCGFLEPPI